MIPKLNLSTDEIDRCIYFNEKLKKFLELNKKTNENISEYNSETITTLRKSKQQLQQTKGRFGLLFYGVFSIGDEETIDSVMTIYTSLEDQEKFVRKLIKTLMHTNIDKVWANAIQELVCNNIKSRCDRLNKLIFPELIKTSELNLYNYYLELKGITLEDDIVNHIDDGEAKYCDYIKNTINQCIQALPEEKLYELTNPRKKYLEFKKKSEHNHQDLTAEEFDDIQEYNTDMLQKWMKDMVDTEERIGNKINNLYHRAFSIIETIDNVPSGESRFKIIAVAKNIPDYYTDTSDFKWVNCSKGKYSTSSAFDKITPVFYDYETEKFDNIVKHFVDKGYIVSTIDFSIETSGNKEVVYDYYKTISTSIEGCYFHPDIRDKVVKIKQLKHDTMCTIKTVLIINEAYALYGKDHPINKNSKLNRLLNRMNEMYIPNLDEEAQIQSVDSNDRFILGNIIGRILGIKRSAINCINININSILVDEDGIWIEKIKSLINFNSYDSNDLKRLYEVLDHYNKSYQIPNEFELDDAKYFKNGNGTYLKEKIRKKHENAFYPYCPYFSYCDSYENKRPELEFISESEFRDAYIYRYKRFPKNYNKTLLVF